MSGLSSDDIIRMAREVADKDKVDPVHNDMVTLTVDELGRLLAAERNRTWTQDHWTEYERSIAAAEREACAKVCEDTYFGSDADYYGSEHAAAIRARGSDAA
jgi:hypothetical protein